MNIPERIDIRAITKVLNVNGFSYHTYENKQKRPIKVIVKKCTLLEKHTRLVEN